MRKCECGDVVFENEFFYILFNNENFKKFNALVFLVKFLPHSLSSRRDLGLVVENRLERFEFRSLRDDKLYV